MLSKTLEGMLRDDQKLKVMGDSARKIAKDDTLDVIYKEIVGLL